MDINEDYKMTKAKQCFHCQPLVDENDRLRQRIESKEQSLANANDQIERLRERVREVEYENKSYKKYYVTRTAYNLIQGLLDKEREVNRWIPVSEMPPTENQQCHFYNEYTDIYWAGRYRCGNSYQEPQPSVKGHRADCCGRFTNPTHWKPITNPQEDV